MQNSLGRKGLFLGIIILFIGSAVLPSISGTFIERHCSQYYKTIFMNFNSHGNILYVGGDGPGNYSTIQDAINDSSNEDTVFVYNDSSPYYENIVVDKSINLTGEDKETTVIDGGGLADVIRIDWNWVIVSGFTIKNSGENDRGINIGSDQNNIFDNIILNNGIGIDLRFSNNNTISNNNINSNNKYGIYVYRSNRNNITGNLISSNIKIGIILRGSNFNIISGNNINSNKYLGVYITSCTIVTTSVEITSQFNIIEGNQITSNSGVGIYFLNSGFNTIIKNNFFDNELDAFIKNALFHRNRWRQNYWDKPLVLPKLLSRVIFISGFRVSPNFIIYLPWFSIDWHPAREPNDI